MKRAKQRKRKFSWFREVERDVWREMTKPTEKLILNARMPGKSTLAKLIKGEIGKLDCGITIVDGKGKKWKV